MFQKHITQYANYGSDDEQIESEVEFDQGDIGEDALSPEFSKSTTKIVRYL